METTTRWLDKKICDLESAMRLLLDSVENDEKGKSITWANWKLEQVFSESKEISFNGRTINYNMVKYEFDQIADGDQPIEDRTDRKAGFIIVYKTGSSLNYIINQNTSAMKMLRRLLSYNGKSEIERNMFDFNNDFFIWLINRIYNENCMIETSSGSDIQYELETIRSFKGSSDDRQTTVSAYGESVMKLISTLSFLLESDSLNRMQVELSCTGHEKISLVLQKGIVSIDLDSYMGKYEPYKDDVSLAELYLMVYLSTLPNLIQEYHADIENDMWNQKCYCDFLSVVGRDLQNRIEGKILLINDRRMNAEQSVDSTATIESGRKV